MHQLSFDLDWNLTDGTDEADPNDVPTLKPSAPTPTCLVIEDKFQPLFTSAVWAVVASVGTTEVARSKDADRPHTAAFLRQWGRQVIRSNLNELRSLGVDVATEYTRLGGVADDLK